MLFFKKCASSIANQTTLVPRPPPFLLFVCVHDMLHKSREKQGRPGSMYVSGCEVDVRGGGVDIEICMH